ncbi:TetR/AcrR family transcriptional regulator [Amycolatopsis roodepoortensis]|uniref:AcrR family transcriptional regulator n=1 Tax=Amycolatopsis roodepoortensis TaxID=700274 RepID=A0ABR9L5Q4_9PSEU|nr:TetR/AcrR family transcriptional regulator [Amycolatopsis roodepoortensis]MBE1576054.1 AcrR family transcriptional regulator [Amycolatopsis roodepoortensis]
MSGTGTARGRIDKRQAILDAAFTVFAREGYAQAGVDVIAAEAGVAKATVYSHYGDKESLFRETVSASADRALAENLAVVERLTGAGEDLRATLETVGSKLLECYCADRSWALRRLLAAETGQFPDLLDVIHTRAADRVAEALADRLARLTVSGHLRTADPLLAADQFFALLSGPADKRARLGTRRTPDAELRAIAEAAVDTFLKAFGAQG